MARAQLKLQGKGFQFLVPLGDGPITPTGGGPNIEERARPGRPALTLANGQKLKTFDVPAFWDGITGLARKENIKPDVMDVVGLSTELPLADFTAEGPFPYSGGRFVMEWPEWVRLLPFPSGDGLMQAELVLKLVEFNDPKVIKPHKRGQQHAGLADNRAVGAITLDRPESLVEVAARYTHDPGEAKAIGKANDIHDIKRKLPKGTRLQIPAG